MSAVALQRTDLFPTPVWTTSFDLGSDDHANLLRDALRLVDRSRASDRPFRQTSPIDHVVDGPWWRRYFDGVADVIDRILPHLPSAVEDDFEGHHTTWVLAISDSSEFDPAGGVVDLLHAHPRTTLASIYYLDLPDELLADPRSGTLLRSPVGGPGQDFMESNLYVPSRIDQLLVFPAHLEHAPARPDVVGTFSRPRVVIVSNWC